MAFTVPPLYAPKSNFNPAPAPAVAHQYWAAADATYVSAAFLSHSNDLNALSSSLNIVSGTQQSLGTAGVLVQATSTLPGAINIANMATPVTFASSGSEAQLRLLAPSSGTASLLVGVGSNASAGGMDAAFKSRSFALTLYTDSPYMNIRADEDLWGSLVKIDSSNPLWLDIKTTASQGIDMSGSFITSLPAGTTTGHAVEYDQFALVSATIDILAGGFGDFPLRVGNWPYSGSSTPSGGLHPTSGSMSATLDRLWGDFYAHIPQDVASTNYASGVANALTSGTGNLYASVPGALYLHSDNYVWRVIIADDGALSSSIVASYP